MMAGRGKLGQTKGKKDKSPARDALPVRSPFDEFKLSPSTSGRRSSDANLLPGLPDKTPRTRKNKSPLTKASTTKDGTIEVPGLGSRLEQIIDDNHQSNHFGEPPVKEHQAPITEVNSEKSNESSDTLSGTKGLLSIDKSNESSSISVGDKTLMQLSRALKAHSLKRVTKTQAKQTPSSRAMKTQARK